MFPSPLRSVYGRRGVILRLRKLDALRFGEIVRFP